MGDQTNGGVHLHNFAHDDPAVRVISFDDVVTCPMPNEGSIGSGEIGAPRVGIDGVFTHTVELR
jgi:hypothetical protein